MIELATQEDAALVVAMARFYQEEAGDQGWVF